MATPSVNVPMPTSSAQTPNLVQQGKTLYDEGKFAQSVKALQQALQVYQAQGDKPRQALTLSNLSLAYQQLGLWSEAKQAISQSLNLLGYPGQKRAGGAGDAGGAGGEKQNLEVLAQALDIQGRLQLTLGEAEQALTTWQQAAATYAQAGDGAGEIRSRINSVQALRALGLYSRALTTLNQLNQTLRATPDSLTKVVGLRSLGEVLLLVGDLDQSRQSLTQSLQIAQRLQSRPEISAALLSLGNTASAQQDTKAALNYYQQAAIASPSQTTKIQTQLNELSLLLETKQWSDAQTLWPQIQPQIAELPPSRTAVYARINFAQSLMKLRTQEPVRREQGVQGVQGEMREMREIGEMGELGKSYLSSLPSSPPSPPSPSSPSSPSSPYPPITSSSVAELLATSVKQAKSLGDRRAEAYALGSLGGLYEQTQQWSDAKSLTQQALLITQSINAPDIAYVWQWQLGRLLNAQGDTSGAIAAYTDAVNTLQSLRNDLVSINPSVQFSFQESVEPVYRQLVGLLLEPSQTPLVKGEAKGVPSQKNLAQARTIFESLKAAELVNFFRAACLDAKPVQLDRVDPEAAVIYPVILEDRLEVILSLPQQPLRHYATFLPQNQVENTLDRLRQDIVIRYSQDFLPLSQQVYNWLIRPAEADINKSGVKTLVFVLDSSLQKLPMAALHDGKQYLVEKYGVAITPSLQLLQPQPLKREQLKVLTAGLTEARGDFPALTNVANELNKIKSEVPSKELLNQGFTSAALKNQIKSLPYPVVHIASHTQFGSKADDTFILAWDGRINVKQLDDLMRVRDPSQSQNNTIELLVLSGCRTVTGDRRAALGMAGVAVRAGARSTLATLWYVNDAATVPLMSQFYQELGNTKVTKAEALRRAQQTLLQSPQYRHPVYWAPYVLVGNWL